MWMFGAVAGCGEANWPYRMVAMAIICGLFWFPVMCFSHQGSAKNIFSIASGVAVLDVLNPGVRVGWLGKSG